jgi:hypothetical protein
MSEMSQGPEKLSWRAFMALLGAAFPVMALTVIPIWGWLARYIVVGQAVCLLTDNIAPFDRDRFDLAGAVRAVVIWPAWWPLYLYRRWICGGGGKHGRRP